MKCLMCNNDIGTRKGKVVCSTSCRVHKKEAFDYFDAVLKNLISMTGYDENKCLEGIMADEKKRKRSVSIFEAWMETRGKSIRTVSPKRRKRL